jgi:hypothetical protein
VPWISFHVLSMQRLLGKRAGLQTGWFQACLNSELGLTVEAASFLCKGLSRLRKQPPESFVFPCIHHRSRVADAYVETRVLTLDAKTFSAGPHSAGFPSVLLL